LENSPEKRLESELQPVAALASKAATASLATDFPTFCALLTRMDSTYTHATIVGVIKAR
jgi:hypothetical protein